MKLQKSENVITFKKFTCREQALNTARYVTESERWKQWEWYEENALHAAIRTGNDVMVKLLLEAGADPTLEGCRGDSDNKFDCWKLLQKLKHSCKKIRYNNIEMMLKVASKFWNKASYADIHAGSEGARRNWFNANTCKNLELMQKELKALEEFCTWEKIN